MRLWREISKYAAHDSLVKRKMKGDETSRGVRRRVTLMIKVIKGGMD